MSETINTVAAVTRNFLVDTDDLIDELLSAIKAHDWRSLKMQYQVGKLHATKEAQENGQQDYDLLVEWNEFDEEVQLRIAVAGTDDTLTSRQQECSDLMNAMFPNDIFRKVNEDN
ncbi:hypothetical protein BH10CYA1_BH10CYA1_49250 [soil metagenome]